MDGVTLSLLELLIEAKMFFFKTMKCSNYIYLDNTICDEMTTARCVITCCFTNWCFTHGQTSLVALEHHSRALQDDENWITNIRRHGKKGKKKKKNTKMWKNIENKLGLSCAKLSSSLAS